MNDIRSLIPVMGLLGLTFAFPAKGQKKVSELTVTYEYTVGSDSAGKQGEAGARASHTVYIKGNKSRSETGNSLFSSTTILDSGTGFGVILREVSGQKLLIRLNPDNWQERSRNYDGMVYKNTGETKQIAGYKCIKAVGTTGAGATITVYYTRDLVPENRDYDPAFKNLDGLPLEYELTKGNMAIRYKVSSINFNPVPASRFDIPKSGYREMNYEESKKLGN